MRRLLRDLSKAKVALVVPVYSNSPGSLLNAATDPGSPCCFKKAAFQAHTAHFPPPKSIWNNKGLSFPRVSEPSSQPCETNGPQVMKAALGTEAGGRTYFVTHSSS